MEVLIIGAGIGGLTLGLMLHRAGIACRIFEAAPELKAVGVGINILPHASRELCALGLEQALAKVAVITREYCFTIASASSSTANRPGALPATTCRNSPSIAATCKWCCSTPSSNAPALTR